MRFGFSLVAEVAYVCGAVEDVNISVVCFRDNLVDSLVIGHLKVEVQDDCAGIVMRFEAVQLANNDLNNNFILGSSAWEVWVQKFLVLGLAHLVPLGQVDTGCNP